MAWMQGLPVADWLRYGASPTLLGQRYGSMAPGGPNRLVLVEGGSDKAAVEVLAGRRGQLLGGAGLHVVAMGGATSIGHFLAVLGPCGIGAGIGGL